MELDPHAPTNVDAEDVRQWTDADMAQAYLAGHNAAGGRGELADIAEGFGFWLGEVYEPIDGGESDG